MSDSSLLILFGSESGNAEDLASIAGKQAKSQGLSPTVKGMDEIEIGDIAASKNILVYCSTWGEGEMPDIAIDLWEAANGDAAPDLSGCNFAVCALGDTSYEFFCQSGKDWDGWFEKQGANRILDRVDCDVEYDEPAAEFTSSALSIFSSMSGGTSAEPKLDEESEAKEPPTAHKSTTGGQETAEGSNELLILFGSESGNAEDLASTAGKQAKSQGLSPTVKGMDEIEIGELAASKNVLIYCSTWGEGDMPDNAIDLWEAANGDAAPDLSGCKFAICALGDTSYEFFCQSGKDWDAWFEKQGATRIVDRLDCDVEYDEPAAEFTSSALSIFSSFSAGAPKESDAVNESNADPALVAQDQGEASVDGLEDLLSSGDRSLTLLFGSQSGNSEGLAAKIAKDAKAYGLEGEIHDMDGFDFNSLATKKRVMIVCSTWGEGEMPDNAEDLWQFSISDSASRLEGVHFAILALGDSSYEFFCQSGKDWDGQFEKLGATRAIERLDCDVDYDAPAAEWLLEALPSLAAVDSTGHFHEEMIDSIKMYASGDSLGAEGEDGFSMPEIAIEAIQVEATIFRYDPETSTTGTDTWLCSLSANMSVLEVLRTLKMTQDGSLTFRDGTADDPNTAISVNGRLVLPGLTRLDSVAPMRDGQVSLRIEPLPGFDVIRDLAIDPWSLERKRESSEPWMVAATREGAQTPQGVIGTMEPGAAAKIHSIRNFSSQNIIHSSSDAIPHANGYLGPAVIASSWSRRNDPRTSPTKRKAIDEMLSSHNGIKAETDFAPIRRQSSVPRQVSDALLEAKNSVMTDEGFNGKHGKHVWWYTWSVKSSGLVNDTVIYRQALGPFALLGNLFSGVTARMVLGFTRTGGNMFNGMLGMVAPPAGIGKMPKQFNSSVDKHHEVVAIFNEMDGRF